MRVTAVGILCALLAGWATAQPPRHDRVFVVPVANAVTVDGALGEWDLSGAIEGAFDESLRPRFTVRAALMYDEAALYIGAHVADDTPLLNRHDPEVEPNQGWAADALQVRLCSDPTAAYPLARSNSDRICHLTMWLFTDKQLPVLHVQYGMDYHGTKLWSGGESGLAFQKDRDGRGYTFEARVPWERLNAAANPPKAGDRIALVLQSLWGDSTGTKNVQSFNEVIRSVGFSFQNTGMWGQAIFLDKGHLPTAERAAAEQLSPLSLALPVPDPEAKSLSAAVFDAQGQLVRTLPVLSSPSEIRHPQLAIPWDGLDDDGRPLPQGRYTVKTLSHRGIGQKYVTSLHNPGNPPWRTDDGTGAWGGDHGPALAAAADAKRVYLGWAISEAGAAVIALETAFTPDGKPRKLWGQHQVLELGIVVTAMASDGERLFVAQDGKGWGQDWADPKLLNKAGIVLWNTQSGRPVNFPFGQRTLVVSEWPDALKPPEVQPYERYARNLPLIPRKQFWQRLREHDFGPQELGYNLLGIAVTGDLVYASLRFEDKVVAVNWRTGKREKEFAVPKPAGVALAKDGSLVTVSDKRIVRLNPQSGQMAVLAEKLSSPWGVALDAEGRIYVSDCGDAMQVKVFDARGKQLSSIGKPGGRAWVGAYDPGGVLQPAGLTVDREGKVWVTEYDSTPRRVSVWSREGKRLADLLGPGGYAVEGLADEQNPRLVNTHHTLFEVNYESGAWRTLATLIRPRMRGFQFMPDTQGFMGRALRMRHLRGQTYAAHTGRGGVVIYRVRDQVAEPMAAIGPSQSVLVHGFTKEDLPADVRNDFMNKRHLLSFWWSDTNGDGLVQTDEFALEQVSEVWGLYWGTWVDEDLTVWSVSRKGGVWRIPVKEWLPNGVPVYPRPGEQRPLFQPVGNSVHAVMHAGDVYLLEQNDGAALSGSGAKWSAVSRYTHEGRRLWAYRRAWVDKGLEAPLARPGDVVGAMKFVGHVKLDSGAQLIAVNGYFGHFNLLTDEGLWAAWLCKDTRYGPVADENAIWPENFLGQVFRNRENGKVYLIAGDTDVRIWEVTGLETLRAAKAEWTLTEGDQQKALQAAARRLGVAGDRPPLRLRRAAAGLLVDGDLADWDLTAAAALDAGAGRGAKASLAYDDKNLYLAFDVRDDSPMKNNGKDFALLFKTGDVCDVFLATDPAADPRRAKPSPGDVRLLLSVLDEQPMCVLYEPVVREGERAPRLFSSPVGAEPFDRVVVVKDAQVSLRRSANGYTLEAAVPLSALRFAPRPGGVMKGDVGVIFSDPGGSRNVLRTGYANKDTGVTNDIPTEARLEPGKWGLVRVE